MSLYKGFESSFETMGVKFILDKEFDKMGADGQNKDNLWAQVHHVVQTIIAMH